MKQLAEALKITVELTVQEWNDFDLAVTRMVDVHVNKSRAFSHTNAHANTHLQTRIQTHNTHTTTHQLTGSDHPFSEELVDRNPDNVRAFVGEIIYRVAE